MTPNEAYDRRQWAVNEFKQFLELYTLNFDFQAYHWALRGLLKVRTMQLIEHDRALDGRELLDGVKTNN